MLCCPPPPLFPCCRSTLSNLSLDVDVIDDSVRRRFLPPGIDSDVGNLLVTPLGITTHVTLNIPIPLAKAIKHAKQKQFVFFYNVEDRHTYSQCEYRLVKYFTRGWQCLNICPNQLTQLRQFHYLCTPKEKYMKKWWE
eukprot:TRINITY_DN20255_c0_g1_i1.p1 TRINITY_DN20255_c0_g1~~TRINITY_DN20255_c0_g1_i1.p1  ORF type:complete len:160 (+),score=31.24 TRINITY_DN20255_c0_g1_i1:68-481(+)